MRNAQVVDVEEVLDDDVIPHPSYSETFWVPEIQELSILTRRQVQGLTRNFTRLKEPISNPTFTRYLKSIQRLMEGRPCWDYEPKGRAYPRNAVQIFLIFVDLANRFGKSYAEHVLLEELKKYGYEIERKQQRYQQQRKHDRTTRDGYSQGKSRDYSKYF